MLRHRVAVMIGSRSIVGVLALLLTVVSANAFQETAPVQPPASGSASETDESGLGLADDDSAAAGGGAIAGGVPNLNFGLELLYGGKSSPDAMPNEDDVGLKGRLKHTF